MDKEYTKLIANRGEPVSKKRKITLLVIGMILLLLANGNIVPIGKAVAKDILRGGGREKAVKTVSFQQSYEDENTPQIELLDIDEYVQSIKIEIAEPFDEMVILHLYKRYEEGGEGLKLISGAIMQPGQTEVVMEAHYNLEDAILRAQTTKDIDVSEEGFYKEISVSNAVVNEDYQGPITYTVNHFVQYYQENFVEILTRVLLIVGLAFALLFLSNMGIIQRFWKPIVGTVFALTLISVLCFVFNAIRKYKGWSGYQVALVIIGCLLFILAVGVGYLLYIKKDEIYNIYFFSGLIFGLIFLIMMPVYTVPDEQIHLSTTYELSNWMLGYPTNEDGTIPMRQDDYNFGEIAKGHNVATSDQYYKSIFKMATNREMIDTERVTAKTWHIQYLFGALGISLGRLLGLGAVLTLLLGRLFNLLFFVTCTRYAIKQIPVGKYAVFTMALLPMTLQQTMSYSYDVVLLATTFLLIAIVFKYAYEKNVVINKCDFVIMLICVMISGIVKGHAYFPMIALPMLIVISRFKENKKLAYISLAIVGFGILTLGASVVLQNIVFPPSTEMHEGYKNYIEWADMEGFTLEELISNPRLLFEVIRNTISIHGLFYLQSMIGTVLGWYEITYSTICEKLFMICLVVQAIPSKNNQVVLPKKTTIICWGIALLETAFIFMGMLLAWSPRAFMIVEGVQGRYLIPVVVLMLVSLRGKKHLLGEQFNKTAMIVQMLAIGIAISDVVMRF